MIGAEKPAIRLSRFRRIVLRRVVQKVLSRNTSRKTSKPTQGLFITPAILASGACRVKGGALEIGAQSYRVLVADDPALLAGELGGVLQEFTAGGGAVVAVADASRAPAVPANIHSIASAEGIPAAVEQYVPEDLRLFPPAPSLRASHLLKEGLHFYLLVNEGEEAVRGELELPAHGAVERWDAWSGRTERAPCSWTDGRRLRVPLDLPRRESVIYCLDPARRPELVERGIGIEASCVESILDGGWLVECPLWPGPVKRGLGSWTDWLGMAEYSGQVTYATSFDLAGPYARVELDLGAVGEIAEVRVNGKKAGFKLWAPFTFDLTKQATPGRNELAVEVANSLANRYHKARLASGLLGPVRVKIYR